MEKKFCTNCGAELDNENFCTNCGAKIENVQVQDPIQDNFKATNVSTVKLYDILFWIGLVAFAIVAIMYVVSSFKYAETYMDFVDMYDSSFLYLLVYYFIGFWGIIGTAITSFKKSTSGRYAVGVTQVIIVAVITIAMPIIKSIFEDSFLDSELNLLLYRMSLGYEAIFAKAIFFEIVSCISFILAKKIDTSLSN